MKRSFKTNLIIASMVTTALLSLSWLGCVNPAAPETVPETPNLLSETPPTPYPESATPQDTVETADATDSVSVNVVYFHRTSRCHSCQYAEEQTVYTLENHFADELNNGVITFISIDVQDAENAATIEKYGAYASQMFITTISGDTEYTEEVIEFWDFIDND